MTYIDIREVKIKGGEIVKKVTIKPEIKIIKRVFLGEFKLEDYMQKEVSLILEKYK